MRLCKGLRTEFMISRKDVVQVIEDVTSRRIFLWMKRPISYDIALLDIIWQ